MIQIDRLKFAYGKRQIFCEHSAVLPDHTLCFGPNGCGKTTLLKLIAKVLSPQSGTIRVDEINHYRAAIILNDEILCDNATLYSHFMWICDAFHRSKDDIFTQAEMFKLDLERYPHELSSGERQWATLVWVSCIRADIWLLDEPLRGLDTVRKKQLSSLLSTIISRKGRICATAHAAESVLCDVLKPVDFVANLQCSNP